MKRAVFLVLSLVVALSGVEAQQFAKTGVVNLSRVSQAYKDAKSKAVEDLRTSIQKELDRMREEIRNLAELRSEAQQKGDVAKTQTLDADISAKKSAFSEFGKKKQEELASAGEALKADTSLQKLLPLEIEQAAISKGFALILSSSNAAVIWYGPDADITDDVITLLQKEIGK